MQKNGTRGMIAIGVLLGAACLAAVGLGLCAKCGFLMEKTPEWYFDVCFAAAAVALLAELVLLGLTAAQKRENTKTLFVFRLIFSDFLLEKSPPKRVAYLGVTAALCIVSNMFEVKFATTQFSLTLFTSMLAGILAGPVAGFCAVMLGDGLGYLVNSMGYPYYWWVALACAASALLAGLLYRLPFRFRGNLYVRLALICVATLLICSVGINSTGMYYLGLEIYMPRNVLELAAERFGGTLNFGVYLIIRFFLLGQIYNSLINYALLFAVMPVLEKIARRGGKSEGEIPQKL